MRNEGAALFTDNPQLEIRTFSFTTPTGHVNASGKLNFNGLTAADLNDIKPMLAKMQAELNLDVSQTSSKTSPSPKRAGVCHGKPQQLQEQKEVGRHHPPAHQRKPENHDSRRLHRQRKRAVKTQLTVADNKIQLNGKPFQLQANEDVFADLENDASAPASAATSTAASAP